MLNGIHWMAVFASAVLYWIIGGVWYAAVFSKAYQDGLGFNPEQKARADKDFPKALAAHFLSGLITCVVLSGIVRAAGAEGFVSGMAVGLWVFLIAFTLNLNYLAFEKRPRSLFFLNNGFFLVAFAVASGILAVWR